MAWPKAIGRVKSMNNETRWLAFDHRRVAVDEQGYLLDRADWDEALAAVMAERDGVTLGSEHWQVLRLIADHFDRNGRSPPMRVLVREVAGALGSERADSRALYRLFPQGPAKQAARYAGLPRPASCI